MLVRADQVGGAGRGIEAAGEKADPVAEILADRQMLARSRLAAACRRSGRGSASPLRRAASSSQTGRPLAVAQGRIGQRRAEPGRARPGLAVGRRQGRVVGRGRREPAGIDHALGEARLSGERQSGVAEAPLLRAPRRDEVGRAGRMADILVRRGQRARRRSCRSGLAGASPFKTSASFQARFSASWMPGIGAARAEGRDLMRRVAGEDTRPWTKRSSRRHWNV